MKIDHVTARMLNAKAGEIVGAAIIFTAYTDPSNPNADERAVLKDHMKKVREICGTATFADADSEMLRRLMICSCERALEILRS